MNEQFKRIKINDTETEYLILPSGDVWSPKTNKFLKKHTDKNGYVRVKLTIDGRRKAKLYSIHRLVANAYIPNPENKPDINHKDGIKSHNNVENLEWVTKSENIIHAMEHGLKPITYGEKHGRTSYSNKQIEQVCELMEEGYLTLAEISNIMSVTMNTLYHILRKNAWVRISDKYNIHNYRKVSKNYSLDDYEKVFKALVDNELSFYDISDSTGVSVNTIRHIYHHNKPNPVYEILYNKYDISKYTNDKVYSKAHLLNNDVIMECKLLLEKKLASKYIKRIISKKYSLNEEFILIHVLNKEKP